MNFNYYGAIDPNSLALAKPLLFNGQLIHRMRLDYDGQHEYEKYTWVAFEDVAEALGLVFKQKEGSYPGCYDVRLTNPRFFKFVEDGNYSNTYYCRSIKGMPIETWDITQAWDLGRNESQALQYILRAQYKGQEKEDLEKAIKFLKRALEEMEED